MASSQTDKSFPKGLPALRRFFSEFNQKSKTFRCTINQTYTNSVKLIGKTEITTIEEPDRLQFTVIRKSGWIDYVVFPAFLISFIITAWINKTWWILMFPAIGVLYFIANRSYIPPTRLSVTEDGLIASANLIPNSTNTLRIAAWELLYLAYFSGGEDEPPCGLYAYLEGTKICLIPDLDRNAATTITDAIRLKYPLLERGDPSTASILHGDDSGVITLGLSTVSSSQSESTVPKD